MNFTIKFKHAALAAFAAFSVAAVTLAMTFAVTVMANSLPSGKPEDAGFSAERLQRIHEAMQRHIDAGDISGAVTLVARKGRIVHFETHGVTDLDSKKPMTKDAVFQLASMSKPITAVAVLMLLEEGKIHLDDPVSKFIPEFKDMKVAVAKDPSRAPGASASADAEFTLVPASREVTVRDLLTHSSGLGSGGLGSRQVPKIAPHGANDTLAGYIPKLAAVPLDFQPGTLWRYSPLLGFETLSRIVEIASGQPYDRFLKERIFDPLGMKDTGFILTDDRKARLVTIYQRSPTGLQKLNPQTPNISSTYFSGAGGLMSTAEDYSQFAQMLLDRGQLNGKRLLGPNTVEMMSANHMGELFAGQFPGYPPHGVGFGLGVSVMIDQIAAGMRVTNGSFGWNGAYGTKLWVDPKENMVEILMIQTNNPAIHRDFENAVMQALIE